MTDLHKIRAAKVRAAEQAAIADLPPELLNGMTEQETAQTASVAGLTTAIPAPEGGELPALPHPLLIAGGGQSWFSADQMRAYARAALAAQPQAPVALTEEALLDGFCKARHSQHYASVFIAGARFAEHAHGIPAPQTKEPTNDR